MYLCWSSWMVFAGVLDDTKALDRFVKTDDSKVFSRGKSYNEFVKRYIPETCSYRMILTSDDITDLYLISCCQLIWTWTNRGKEGKDATMLPYCNIRIIRLYGTEMNLDSFTDNRACNIRLNLRPVTLRTLTSLDRVMVEMMLRGVEGMLRYIYAWLRSRAARLEYI